MKIVLHTEETEDWHGVGNRPGKAMAFPGRCLLMGYFGTTCIIRKFFALSLKGYGVSLFAPNHFS